MEQERRKFPRIDFRLKVMINDGRSSGKLMNFSTSGAFIQTPSLSQLRQGDEIGLTMKLPLEKRPTRIKAQVAHTEKGVGVKFIDLLPQDSTDIEYCFEVFKHTIPLPGT